METTRFELSPPPLHDIAAVLQCALRKNYTTASSTVIKCPDLRQPPFNLACEGLCGSEIIADIGGQAHLFPQPRLDKNYSLIECAKAMGMTPEKGSLIGAGAGPHHVHGVPSELAPNLNWKDGFDNVNNLTRSARLSITNSTEAQGRARCAAESGPVVCPCSSTAEFSLMMNVYGSQGLPGDVLRVTARGRRGSIASFSECMRRALRAGYGEKRQVSLGGVFLIKQGAARFHVMPPFPPRDELPFASQEALDGWLSYHTFSGPMVCLSILHSADPENTGVRLEHTHCFNERNEGGHYHYDVDAGGEEVVEYEGYFNVAKDFVQIDKPVAV